MTHLFAISAVVLVVSGCSSAGNGETQIIDDKGSTLAVVSYIDLEGGFYGIITDDGEHHEPVNLHVDYQVDGLRISYKYTTLQDVASFRMWGTPIEILEIRERAER
ncbi:MAG: hypothetical protein IIA59_07685 [Candidatus Marinimicrobia bacterium]|nr:hypothetical protein [Candidatus Neomarinimicrobiota bacterium]